MNIVVVDSNNLIGEADFPEIELNKYGWHQFTQLAEDEIYERCWRADVVISVSTPIPQQVIKKALKLQLVIAAGDSTDHISRQACEQRDIRIAHVPGLNGDTPENTQIICQQVTDIINAWLKGNALNSPF